MKSYRDHLPHRPGFPLTFPTLDGTTATPRAPGLVATLLRRIKDLKHG